MRVLVTGGAGYIGSRVTAHLIENGHHVTVFDRMLFAGEGLLAFLDHPRLRMAVGDVRDMDTLSPILGEVDAVVHLAALVGEDACNVDTDATRAINEGAAISLLEEANRRGVRRFIFLSTCSNYGVSEPNVLATEDNALNPLSLYAETKVAAEKALLAFPDSVTAPTLLRFGTICGLSPRMRFDLLVNEMGRDAVAGEEILIYSPSAYRPFLHIRDAARAIEHCLGAPVDKVRSRVFNVVGENYRKSQLADLVKKHFPGAVIRVNAGKVDNRDYRVSSERVENELGFTTEHTVEDAFTEVAKAVEAGLFSDLKQQHYRSIPDGELIARRG